MKFIGITVTYYPDKNVVYNLLTYIHGVDFLIIWENTPLKDRSKYRVTLPDKYKTKIIYFGEDENKRLGYAYNRGVEYGITHGFTHLLTMDQDSKFIEFQ